MTPRLASASWCGASVAKGRSTSLCTVAMRSSSSSAEEFRRLQSERTGQVLIDALQASPHRDIEIEPQRAPMPVRDLAL